MSDTGILPIRGSTVADARVICFSFTTNGGSNPAASSYQGFGISSITYAATGKYTVVFTNADTMAKVIFAHAAVQDTSSPDTNAWAATCYWDTTASGGPSLQIQCRTGNAWTVADPTSGQQVSVMMVVSASGVGYGYA